MKARFTFLASIFVIAGMAAFAPSAVAAAHAAPSGNDSADSGLISQAGEAAEAATRDSYVRTLEPICRRDTARNARILRGARKQVARGRLARPARQFRKATKAFTGTLRQVVRTPRPAADRQTLGRWIAFLRKQRKYLQQISRALSRGRGFEAQRLAVLLMSNANKANSTVVGYGFRHCIIRPNKFL